MEYRAIAVTDLHFDPDNPRIPPLVDAADDSQVLDWMLSDAGLVELMGSIAVKGFFPAEPLLVMPNPAGPGYLVLEGNRRLAAVRLLLEPDLAPQRKNAVAAVADEVVDRAQLQALPCAIFELREKVLDYLGFRHITGVKQWEPEAKARYMQSLYARHIPDAGEEVYRLIARIIGSRADYVSRLLASLRLHEAIVADAELQRTLAEDNKPYSLVTLAVTYRAVNDYLNIEKLEGMDPDRVNKEHLRNLAVWMFHEKADIGRTQLGDSHNMKLLAQALSHEEGELALRRGDTVEEAAAATVNVDELLIRALRQARDRLLGAQRLLHRAAITGTTFDALDELSELLDQIRDASRRKARRDERERV